ncbi:MAG: UbiA family prenyltransferase [Myxococcales bacterium]|nr:UbiA family prenyltransferase [Myxococcales bacterium]
MDHAPPASTPHPLTLLASISRIHIVAIAMLGALTFGWILTGRYFVGLSLLVGFDWFLVNLLNRVVDLPEDRVNAIVGTDFVERHQRAIRRGGLFLLAASLVATLLLAPLLTAWRVAYHLLGLAYNWPLFGRRIKERYFFKNTASAMGFLITLFAYPLTWNGVGSALAPGVSGATVGVALLFFFAFELSYEVIYDLRDVEGDRVARVQSYPVVHGERGAVAIIDALLFAALMTLGVGYAVGVVPWRLFIMVCAPLIQFVYYKLVLRRGITSRDCVNLTWIGALLLALYHLWWALGLPGSELG